jgi:ABC-type antimicrobial peptide transport system permease subunit
LLPLSYVLRNARRRLRTGLTVAGIALVVAVYFLMGSVAETLVRSFRSTGAADEVVLVQAGALTVAYSNVERGTLTWVQTLDGVAAEDGRPLVSPELALGSVVALNGSERKISLRGVTSIAPSVYRQVRLATGRWPGPGRRAAIGPAAAAKLGVRLGERLDIEGDSWQIAGLLDSGGRVYDQEIWLDLDELAAAANRTTYSGYTLRATSSTAVPDLVETINEGRRFPLSAQPASEFYQRTAGMAFFMASLGELVAFVVAIGAVFGGMNTMYAAVAARRREIAVLRALGYRRPAILGAFLLESLLIALAAGVLGILLGTAIALGGAVGLAPRQALSALLLSAAIGLLGGGLPAFQAARTAIVEQLR